MLSTCQKKTVLSVKKNPDTYKVLPCPQKFFGLYPSQITFRVWIVGPKKDDALE